MSEKNKKKDLGDTPILGIPEENLDVPIDLEDSVLNASIKTHQDKLKLPLSRRALEWRTRLARLAITPEQWIARYPDDSDNHYIKELI
jgi:hypothetical protein